MYFDINKYEGKYVMHCKTEEEAESFCQYLHENGRKWCNGDHYTGNTRWDWYKEKTAYRFNGGCYSDLPYYISEGYTILEWSDYMEDTVLNDTLYSKYTK